MNSTLRSIVTYRKVYRNWVKILYKVKFDKQRQEVIEVKFRNGKSGTFPIAAVNLIKDLIYKGYSGIKEDFVFDKVNGIFTFPYNKKIVKLKFIDKGIVNGEFTSYAGDYSFLEPLELTTVIDIGANIGDSTVWFGIMGASKIIALEPYPYSFRFANQNLTLNNLESIVVLLNAGYGKDGSIQIEDKISNIGTVLEEHEGGTKIPIISLKTILERYKLLNAKLLLKMDCEGCEYNILTEPEEILNKFNKIVIEYHNGYEDLEHKLEKSGFIVKHTDPHYWYDAETDRHLIQGYIYATNGNH